MDKLNRILTEKSSIPLNEQVFRSLRRKKSAGKIPPASQKQASAKSSCHVTKET
jgi:hypothetical protein